MSSRASQPRRGRLALGIAGAGLFAALLWLFVTILETDSGWGDAIWRYPSASKTTAWTTTVLGSLAAVSAFASARRLQASPTRSVRRWFSASLAAQLILFAAWVTAIYTAPS